MSLDCVAILLGRKGSKGLPGKNTMNILGQPISHYSMIAAKTSKYINNIFVSTDDANIKDEANKLGINIISRPNELCTDSALFEDALIHGYKEIVNILSKKPDIVVILMCNVVTINSKLIDDAIHALLKDPKADSAVTVSNLNMYSPLRARKLGEQGYLLPFVPFETFGNPSTLSCDRDSQGDVYFADMSHSVVRSRALDNIDDGLLPQRWMGTNILPIYQTYGCDIDMQWQVAASKWWLAENDVIVPNILPNVKE
jgi:CMP-N-acetylneuraminic acid synthetase